ncbi:transposase [Marivita sp.]|uniref:transposase n=1 Tax=Marivita sp. TaxID=2003365 RepID=UPI003F6EE6C4
MCTIRRGPGDLTIWVADDVTQNWSALRRRSHEGQARYSDLAIEKCLTLRVVFRLALRRTQGLMRSLARLMRLDIAVPDFSTLSRHSNGLITRKKCETLLGRDYACRRLNRAEDAW